MRRAFSAMPIGGADALAERAGGDVDERQPRRRMAFEIGADLAQLQQLGAIERAGLGPGRVQHRRGVALRQHEPIAVRVLRILRIEAHLGEEQRRHDVGRRQQLVGWPLPASDVERTESIRSRVAMFFRAGISECAINVIGVRDSSVVQTVHRSARP